MTSLSFVRKKWNGFKANVQATWFWRVYGLCAMKRTWSKFLIAVSLFSFLMFVRVAPGLLTPILELEQMRREEGLLLGVNFNPRGHDTLRIKTDAGEERIYFFGNSTGVKARIELSNAAGQRVIVWSQRIYDGWPPFIYEGVMEVKQGSKMLRGYNLTFRKQSLADDIGLLHFLLYPAILPLLVVGWVCRKGTEKT